MAETMTASWWNAFAEEANADVRLNDAAKYFRGRVQMEYGTGTVNFDIADGRVAGITDGPSVRGADIIFRAPRDEWDLIIAGESDLMKATTPGLGRLEVLGDAVLAMDNIRVVHLLRPETSSATPASTSETKSATSLHPSSSSAAKPTGSSTRSRSKPPRAASPTARWWSSKERATTR